ncbi:MAG: tetratricopeptide repeat protein [Fimbriimonadaceae bacterium]|nr:tetratricopeptide repeat protein [Fimbriimonadaceae bacterium]
MSQEQAKAFIEQATQSIQSGQFAQALELADQAIALTPDDSEAQILRGIALSQTQRPDEATEAFRKAISLSPYNAKAYFNLAVHLYGTGQKVEALEMAREAASIDVKHAGARELAARIEAETMAPSTEQTMAHSDPPPGSIGAAGPGPEAPRPAAYPRPEYQPVHSVALVEKMGSNWGTVGWILILISLVIFVGLTAYMVPLFMQAGNPQNFQEAMKQAQANQPAWVQLVGLFGWLNRALLLGWMIMDIMDRRANWLWLVPMVPCCCCGLEWLAPTIYRLAGRK